MRDFQAPQFFTDLYRDLRDRRLLLVVIALLAGIIVVPVALSNSTKPQPVPPAPPTVAANPDTPSVAVVASNPGLRDYRKRLKDLGETDPFAQKFTAPQALDSAQLGATASPASTIAPVPTSSSSTGSAGSAGGATSGGAPSGATKTVTKVKTKTQTKYVVYRIKVQTGEAGGELQTRDNVGTLTLLPSDTVPALAYLGVSTETDKALFMVSGEVSAITGQGACMLGTTTCQLLILKVGQYEDLAWIDGKTYRVKLLKIDKIVRNKPPS